MKNQAIVTPEHGNRSMGGVCRNGQADSMPVRLPSPVRVTRTHSPQFPSHDNQFLPFNAPIGNIGDIHGPAMVTALRATAKVLDMWSCWPRSMMHGPLI